MAVISPRDFKPKINVHGGACCTASPLFTHGTHIAECQLQKNGMLNCADIKTHNTHREFMWQCRNSCHSENKDETSAATTIARFRIDISHIIVFLSFRFFSFLHHCHVKFEFLTFFLNISLSSLVKYEMKFVKRTKRKFTECSKHFMVLALICQWKMQTYRSNYVFAINFQAWAKVAKRHYRIDVPGNALSRATTHIQTHKIGGKWSKIWFIQQSQLQWQP